MTGSFNTRTARFVGLVAAGLALASAGAFAEEPTKVFPADKGPATVDVSAYPDKVQGDYKVFAMKCGKCHTLARPINTDMDKASWKRYVKRMMNKPDSGITPQGGKQIYQFLKYYQLQKDANKAAEPAVK